MGLGATTPPWQTVALGWPSVSGCLLLVRVFTRLRAFSHFLGEGGAGSAAPLPLSSTTTTTRRHTGLALPLPEEEAGQIRSESIPGA